MALAICLSAQMTTYTYAIVLTDGKRANDDSGAVCNSGVFFSMTACFFLNSVQAYGECFNGVND